MIKHPSPFPRTHGNHFPLFQASSDSFIALERGLPFVVPVLNSLQREDAICLSDETLTDIDLCPAIAWYRILEVGSGGSSQLPGGKGVHGVTQDFITGG